MACNTQHPALGFRGALPAAKTEERREVDGREGEGKQGRTASAKDGVLGRQEISVRSIGTSKANEDDNPMEEMGIVDQIR